MDEIIKYAVVAALLSFMCATLLAASAAQAGPDWHLYHGYYNYAPGYMANPALARPSGPYQMLPAFGPPDPASCGGYRC
jgi:hypothetical protein